MKILARCVDQMLNEETIVWGGLVLIHPGCAEWSYLKV